MKNTIFYLVNSRLEKITFSDKTKILIFTIFGGIILISFLMFISIFASKYDFEVLFQNLTKPQVKLENIKDIYQVNIKETLRAIEKKQINKSDGIEVISLANQIIKEQWIEYKKETHFKVSDLSTFASKWLNLFLGENDTLKQGIFEKRMTKNIERKMKNIQESSKELIYKLRQKREFGTNKLINNTILETNSINIYLSTLIRNNLQRAISKKNANDRLFYTSTFMLIVLIGLSFIFILLVSITIINHFKDLHYSLEENINKKTAELLKLNKSLQSKVKKEVEKGRKKDNIMFQQARLASMGEVLHNIAHQWRQPLGAIMMIIQSFETKFEKGKLDKKFIKESVDDALKLGNSMSDTLDDFRNFFMPNRAKQIFDIQTAIDKAIELSKYQLEMQEIQLKFKKDATAQIYGFKNELIHVVLNLLNNSKDVLTLQTSIKPKMIFIITKKTKKNIIINIIDNGGGIKNDIMPKIFDPYFTTKHKSMGTGIGLYMSKQLVERHMQGKIYCKNIKHKFSSKIFYDSLMFSVELPTQESLHE